LKQIRGERNFAAVQIIDKDKYSPVASGIALDNIREILLETVDEGDLFLIFEITYIF
jgi:hypothetical protein